MRNGALAGVLAALCAAGLAIAAFAGPATDTDGDGVFDVVDNCLARKNPPPSDCDTDNDGYGNYCDGDFNNDKAVNATDFTARFLPDFKAGTDKVPIDGTDMNCNGVVSATDYIPHFLPQFKQGKPGPSGLFCAGTVPCDL
jgi:hypothetical protein